MYLQEDEAYLRAKIAKLERAFTARKAALEQELTTLHKKIQDPASWSIRDDLTLGLPRRTYNLLVHKSAAKTVGDLLRMGSRELLKIPGFGRQSLRDVQEEFGDLWPRED
jgi:DNA-directed RNA polymerase alpha subunit